MNKKVTIALGVLGLLLLSQTGYSTTLYSENFDIDPTANWTVNIPASPVTDVIADFNYDYSAIGVPPAPGGSTTRGLKMTANNTAGVFSGFSVSPTGQNFTGYYQVKFDLWQNYVGPLGVGGSGTTQLSMFGVGSAGNVAVWPSSLKESVSFGATLDGGSASDYRAYSSAANSSYAAGNAVYLAPAGAINNSNAYYTAAFAAQSAPAAQLGLYAGQTGSTDPGEISFAWRTVTIDVTGGFATWSVDGLPFAKVDLSTVTLGGGNILFGHSDTNATSSSDPNDYLLNITLIDNVVVSALPEPSALSLLGMGICGLLGLRRR